MALSVIVTRVKNVKVPPSMADMGAMALGQTP